MRILCPVCGDITKSVNRDCFKKLLSTGITPKCPFCNEEARREYTKRGITDSQKRSRNQEKRVARREGGRRQPCSGAMDGFEGDVRRVGKFRGECKFTRAASYRLKLEDLKKIEHQACGSELPVFDLEFQSESPAKRYVVLPEWVYETLMVESGRRDSSEGG